MSFPNAAGWHGAILILSAMGCGTSADVNPSGADSLAATVRDSIGMPRTWRTGKLLLEIGSADGNTDQTLFGVENAVRRSDGVIVVANGGTREVKYFDAAGEYLFSAGRGGSGPGEFIDLQWVASWTGDTIVAYGYRNSRLSFFGPKGELGREVTVRPPEGIPYAVVEALFEDGSMLARAWIRWLGDATREYHPGFGFRGLERKRVMLLHLDADGDGGDSIGWAFEREVFNGGPPRLFMQGPAHFARHTWFDTRGSHFYVADNETYEVKQYEQNGGLIRTIGRRHESLPVTAADIDAVFEEFERRLSRYSPGGQQRHRQRYASMPMPETMPAFGHLGDDGFRVDRAGNLWVREYNRPGDHVPRWSVFDQEGLWIGQLTTPVGLETTEIGDDYVLGMWEDSLDVEYVRLYQLIK